MTSRIIKAADLFCGASGVGTAMVEACHELECEINLTGWNHWDKAMVMPVLKIEGEQYLLDTHFRMLKPHELAAAWKLLSESLESYGTKDIPKFADLLTAIRQATIEAKRFKNEQNT